jgi:septum formation protein
MAADHTDALDGCQKKFLQFRGFCLGTATMSHAPPEPLVLASSSRYRARLLARLHLPFTTASPQVDETPEPGEAGPVLAERLAITKARSLDVETGLIIGSDQVAVCEGQLLGKPGTPKRARHQLHECSGHAVTFYTGLALWAPQSQQLLTHVEPFRVQLRQLSEREIADYVALDNPTDCAGSFKWESLGISLFASMHGEDPTALEGLPLIALCNLLRSLGWSLPPRPERVAH